MLSRSGPPGRNVRIVDGEYGAWDRFFAAGRPAPGYEGLGRDEAEALARANSVAEVRVADWDQPGSTAFTADFRPQRLNLLIHHGRVARAGFG